MSKNVQITRKPSALVLARREQVKDLYFIRNYTINQVAKALDKNVKTIWRDIEAIRDEFLKQINVIDVRAVLMKVYQTRRKVLQRLWKEYDRPIDANTKTYNYRYKVSCLKAIDEIESKWISDLQELGYIPKPEETLNLKQKDDDFVSLLNQLVHNDKPVKESKTNPGKK